MLKGICRHCPRNKMDTIFAYRQNWVSFRPSSLPLPHFQILQAVPRHGVQGPLSRCRDLGKLVWKMGSHTSQSWRRASVMKQQTVRIGPGRSAQDHPPGSVAAQRLTRSQGRKGKSKGPQSRPGFLQPRQRGRKEKGLESWVFSPCRRSSVIQDPETLSRYWDFCGRRTWKGRGPELVVRWVVSAVPHLSWEPSNQPLPQTFMWPICSHGPPPKGPSRSLV